MCAPRARFRLIGVGGIDSGGAALTKIRAGASLIQLYSALIYKGLGLVDDIKSDLASTLLRTGRESAVGNRRRRCGDDHGRGLAGLSGVTSAWIARPRMRGIAVGRSFRDRPKRHGVAWIVRLRGR